MEIISKVEIAYFRSAYGIVLSPCHDMNVLMGGNDAGKSNILKALNLFFNNETDLATPYIFTNDITRFRAREAAEAKGRASIWIKITFNNIFDWKSLPSKFTIKKSWNRYTQEPDITISPQSHAGKKILPQNISRFLNKISFQYVPAVKGRHIFSHYLGKVYDALLNDMGIQFSDSTKELTKQAENAVLEMSEKIKEQLGFDSTIRVPTDLRILFESLDFSTKFEEFDIPLQHRGDGIQARHIPFILDFIAQKSDKHHIWAYEEPENSLEMSKAFELAHQFQKEFSKENQIFLTTHSPAFYDLAGEKVTKWFVESSSPEENAKLRTSVRVVLDSDKPDSSLGIAELVKVRAKELYELNDKINIEINNLKTRLSDYTKAAIVTEGKYDVKILETAWSKLYPDTARSFEIFSCTVVSSHIEEAGATVLKPYLETILPSEHSIKIGIFDQDATGKEHYNNLLHFAEEKNGYRMHRNEKAYAMLLPSPPSDENYWDTRERCIEFLFSKKYLTEGYVTHEYSKKNGGKYTPAQAKFLLTRDDLFADDIVHRVKLKPTKKRGFAETKVPNFPQEAFTNFKPLFEKILSILK